MLGWREVPIDESACGVAARASAPHIAQLFVGAAGTGWPTGTPSSASST